VFIRIVSVYTEWRKVIGCLKSQVIFRTRASNYRALLRKMTYQDKASYDSMPPCSQLSELTWFRGFHYLVRVRRGGLLQLALRERQRER